MACVDNNNGYDSTNKLFTRLSAAYTGIDFSNQLEDSEEFDVFRYRNYYNGAGVAIGDLNNDGFDDVINRGAYVMFGGKSFEIFCSCTEMSIVP